MAFVEKNVAGYISGSGLGFGITGYAAGCPACQLSYPVPVGYLIYKRPDYPAEYPGKP